MTETPPACSGTHSRSWRLPATRPSSFRSGAFPSGAGARPKAGAVLSDDVVQMTCLKLAEDNDDLIVRLFEPTGQAHSTTLSLPCIGFKTKVDLGPFEVKTLRVNPKTRAVRETDLIERPMGK